MATGCQGDTSTTQLLLEHQGEQQATRRPQQQVVQPLPFSALFRVKEKSTKISVPETKDLTAQAEIGNSKCGKCGKLCKSEKGRKQHLKFCQKNVEAAASQETTATELTSNKIQQVTSQSSKKKRPRDTDRPPPPPPPPPPIEQAVIWGQHKIQDLTQVLNGTYDETT